MNNNGGSTGGGSTFVPTRVDKVWVTNDKGYQRRNGGEYGGISYDGWSRGYGGVGGSGGGSGGGGGGGGCGGGFVGVTEVEAMVAKQKYIEMSFLTF